jgi:hypothetical protein
VRTLRRLLFWIVDLAAIAVVVACIVHFSRRKTVDCSWRGMRASCAVEAEDSLGRVESERIDGIRGVAYISGPVVGLVTDATHHDDLALFGTRMIELERPSDAKGLYDFADQRTPDHIAFASGVAHPLWMTVGLLAALVAYAFLSSRARKATRRANV